MVKRLSLVAFFLLGGILLALHLSHVLRPMQPPPVPLSLPFGWMGTEAAVPRGYFRHRLELGFQPRHAWIAVAAEDYRLYVNGILVGRNNFLLRTGSVFQSRMSAQSQRLARTEDFPRGGAAQVAKTSKMEWRMAHFYDVSAHLRPGTNLLAVYVQSQRRNSFSLFGHVQGDGLEAALSGDPRLWCSSTEGHVDGPAPWYDPSIPDLHWAPAQPCPPPGDQPVYSAVDPDVWREPFRAPYLASAVPGEEHFFGTDLPKEGAPPEHGWVRVQTDLAYDLFLDEHWVGSRAPASGVDAYDLTAFLSLRPSRLSVRLQCPPGERQRPGRVAVDGRLGDFAFSSASDWELLPAFHGRWLRGQGSWVQASVQERTAAPGAISLQVAASSTWARVTSWFRWSPLLMGLLVVLALLLSFCHEWAGRSARPSLAQRLIRGAALLVPALLGILAVELLRVRFSESDGMLNFIAPGAGLLWLGTGPLLLAITLVWVALPGRGSDLEPVRSGIFRLGWGEALRRRAASASPMLEAIPPWVWLTLLCLLALAVRWPSIHFHPPSGDDYTSWEAARGILRTGAPRAASKILYTRSPLFHYLLAGWMGIFGEGLASVRSFALLPGVATVAAMYFLVKDLTGRAAPALLAALVLAVDPWLIGLTNLIRFYQLMQCLALLSIHFFLKGFVWRQGKRWQNLCYLTSTAAVLSQEVYATTFASMMLIGMLVYRPFDWKKDLNVWVGFLAMCVIIWMDMRAFAALCMTPHVALSSKSESLFVPHLIDVFGGGTNVLTQLATDFFWMDNGENAFWTGLFLVGAVYWMRRSDESWPPGTDDMPGRAALSCRAMLSLYAIVLLTLPILSILIVPINSRYGYGLYPAYVACALVTAHALLNHYFGPGSRIERLLGGASARRLGRICAGVLCATYLVQGEFFKLRDSYTSYREIDYRHAWDYVAAHRKPGDKIVAVRTPGAGVVFGSVDYYAMVGPGFDGLYQRADGVVDRWSGGRLLWKVDQLRHVLLHHERVWVVVDEPRWPSMPTEYTALLEAACRVESEFFGGQVLLWERSAGRYRTVPDLGGGLDSF